MGRSSGIGQLLKGIIIGVVLILAIIGSMSILDKNNGMSFFAPTAPTQVETIDNSLTTTPIKTTAPRLNDATTETTNSNTSTEEKPQETSNQNNDTASVTKKPERSDGQQESTKAKKTRESGLLQLEVINKKTKDKLNASFIIFDRNDEKITEIHSTESATFRLPVGQYKVVTTLTKANDIERETKPVQQIRIVNIRANSTSSQIFQLKPASTLGVLQVSANNYFNGDSIKADFSVQKENGEVVATRSQVPGSLFKLKAGSYKVTVISGNYSDYRTVVIEPGKSSNEVFKLQDASTQGSVVINILDTISENPVKANIVISNMTGEILQSLKAVSQSELSLPSGDYKISASTENSQSSKMITVVAEQQQQTVFRFDAPSMADTDTDTDTDTSIESGSIRITQNVRITGIDDPEDTELPDEPETGDVSETGNSNEGTTNSASTSSEESTTPEPRRPTTPILRIFAQWGANNTPLKSNFYVQMPNGQNVAKKIYADSAIFNLQPGNYRVTVRSKGRPNIVKSVRISQGQDVSLNFASKKNIVTINKINSNNASIAQQNTMQRSSNTSSGFLVVQMNPPQRAQFIISTRTKREVARVDSVPSGKFKLDVGQYTITAIYNNVRRSKNIEVKAQKTSKLDFKVQDFMRKINNIQPPSSTIIGILRSRILDENGKALKGNLIVTNMKEKIIARANNVSVGFFRLTPAKYKISINYQGLIGSEMITVRKGETIEQAFTIASPR